MKDFEALLATLEFTPPVFRYGIDRFEGEDGYLMDDWYISNWDEILAVGSVLKLADGRIFLVGHICEDGGVGNEDSYHSVYYNEIEGVAHISQLFKEDL